MKSLFRYLVVGAIALYVIWFLLPFFFFHFYGPEYDEALSWAGYDATLNDDLLTIISFGFLFSYGVVSLGLIYFKDWARKAFLALTLLSLASNWGFGLAVYVAFEHAYLQVMTLIDGFLLALMYFSSINKEFENSHNNGMQSDEAKLRR